MKQLFGRISLILSVLALVCLLLPAVAQTEEAASDVSVTNTDLEVIPETEAELSLETAETTSAEPEAFEPIEAETEAEATPTEASEAAVEPVLEEPVEAPRVVEIEISGNERIPTEAIAEKLSLQVGDTFDAKKLEEDRLAIHGMGWFAHVQAVQIPLEEGVKLIFRVTENEAIKDVVLLGVTVKKPSREDLLAQMKTKPGEVANHVYLAQDIAGIEKAYEEEGYVLAKVRGREITDDGVLQLTVLEGVITEVRITGNKKTKRYVIEREMRSKPGEVYNAKVMRKDLNRCFNLGFFEDFRAHPEVGTEPGTVILVVEVKERERTGMATFGGGWGSAGGFVGFVEVSKDNLKGTGQRASLKANFGGTKSYEAAYYNPWIADNHTSINVSGYNRLITREAFKEDGDSFLYDERRIGGGITLSRPLSENSRGYITIRQDDLSIEDLDEDEVPEAEEILAKDESVRSLKLNLVEDTRDLVANPTTGSRTSLTTEFAGITGGANFEKYTIDLRRYFSFGLRPKAEDIAALKKRKVLAMRLQGGTITGTPPFLELFMLGGRDSLRGYEEDRFPGENMALLNTEYRFPLSDTLQGIIFVDVGSAWGGAFSDGYGDASFTTHHSYGAGIQVQSPIGPLRLHYGIGEDGGQLHFGFGQMF